MQDAPPTGSPTPEPQGIGRKRLWRELVGEQLRAERRRRRETLATVAHRANLSLPYLSEVERGTKEPSSEVVAAVAAALDLTLLDLTAAVTEQLRADCAAPSSARRGDYALSA